MTAEVRRNRLVVIPNHEMDVSHPDDSEDEDDAMDIEVGGDGLTGEKRGEDDWMLGL